MLFRSMKLIARNISIKAFENGIEPMAIKKQTSVTDSNCLMVRSKGFTAFFLDGSYRDHPILSISSSVSCSKLMNCPVSVAHEMSAFKRTGIIHSFYLKEVDNELSRVPMGADHENSGYFLESTA